MKTRLLLAALAAISVVAVTSAYAYRERHAIKAWAREAVFPDINRDAMREMVRLRAGIKEGDTQTEIAKKITRHLYQSTLFTGKPWATSSNDAVRYVRTVDHVVANMCATLTSTEIWALALFGVQSRPVNLASEGFVTGEGIAATHTLVEAMVDGKPLLFDPTFNALYSCGEGPMNARKMFACAKAGKVQPIYLSSPRPGRSVEEYPFTLQQMSFAVEAVDRPDLFYTLDLPRSGWLAEARHR